MPAKAASSEALDFTNVRDGGKFTKKRQQAGDYKGRITAVEDAESKKDGVKMWVFTVEINGETYPQYCKLVPEQLWKVRSLFGAAGIVIPKKRMKIDPNKLVGKWIGATLDDDEYEGRLQSTIRATIPVSDIQGSADDEDIDEEEEDEEEEAPPPPPRRAKPKAAPAPDPVEDEDEEELAEEEEEEEEEAPPPPPRRKAAAKKAAPPARSKTQTVDDDELEDLDLEDL